MRRKVLVFAMLAGAFAVPRPATAQSIATVITFEMQVNLTKLSPDLERVRLGCWIQSSALAIPMPSFTTPAQTATQIPGTEAYVTGGQLVATMSLQYPIPASALAPDAIGKQADYSCILLGFSTSLQKWDVLSDNQTTPTFRLNFGSNFSAPNLQGSFVW